MRAWLVTKLCTSVMILSSFFLSEMASISLTAAGLMAILYPATTSQAYCKGFETNAFLLRPDFGIPQVFRVLSQAQTNSMINGLRN